MKARKNVKMRNIFFPALGDVIAIFLSAALALIIEGHHVGLTYPVVAWVLVNVLVI